MSDFDYESHDGLALAALVARGEVSPDELLDAALERAARHNPAINAVVVQREGAARAEIAAGLPEGPFRGVPFLLKDLHVLLEGERTTYGSRFFEDFVADHTSTLTARYRQAGLVVFGRTTSPEFGLTTTTENRVFGVTRNPWNLEHTSGGSSGGASAAVAAGILPVANASDGGGSIRIPASCTGLFGLKPTRGRTPMGPQQGEGWAGMSCVHVVSRSVRDSAAMLDATAGPAVGDPYFAPPPERAWLEEAQQEPGRLRIAFQRETFNETPTHPDCVAAVEDAAQLCASLGHDVEERTLRVDARALRDAAGLIIGSNLRAVLLARAEALGRPFGEDDLEPLTHAMAAGNASASAADYAAAVRTIHNTGRVVAGFLEEVDVMLTPTMATPPLPIGALSLSHHDPLELLANLGATTGFTQLLNASGHPSASVPLFWSDAGLPVGVQITGRYADEATLFRLAGQLEGERPWFDRRPSLA